MFEQKVPEREKYYSIHEFVCMQNPVLERKKCSETKSDSCFFVSPPLIAK